jgi:tetratricopeptide (TPR) repeat protein
MGAGLLGGGCSRHATQAQAQAQAQAKTPAQVQTEAAAQAISAARARVDRDPTAPAWVALGQAYLQAQNKHNNDAFIAFRQALRLDSHNAEAMGGLAEAELRLGDAQDALVWANRTLAVTADDPAAIGVRGRARLAEGDAPEALPDLERALDLDPSLLEARLALITAYLELHKTDQAQAEAVQTVARFPEEARGHYAYAAILDARSRWPEAEQQYRAGLRLDPTNATMKMLLAALLFNQHKDYDEVQRLATQVDAVAPGDGSAAGLAAQALYLSGKQDAGMRALYKANAAHPRNLQILRWIKAGADETGRPEISDAAAKDIARLTNGKS